MRWGKKSAFLGVVDTTAEGSINHYPFLERNISRLKYATNYILWNIASFFKEPNETKLSVIRRKWQGLEKKLRRMDVKVREARCYFKRKKERTPKISEKSSSS